MSIDSYVSVDRQLLSVDRQLLSVDRQLLSVDRQLLSVYRQLLSGNRQLRKCRSTVTKCRSTVTKCRSTVTKCRLLVKRVTFHVPNGPPYKPDKNGGGPPQVFTESREKFFFLQQNLYMLHILPAKANLFCSK